ncbi:MAG: EscU/YscU/HrcU family type III secretion system export apparatus switch protein [Acidimicrobiia bacterium]|nr:EscU/YscU/HrcU family type III secretion system export apparatus switch protein [Acidimicrobiia bacterium]
MSRSQERTEKPTERRKREARREGRVAKSAEVGSAVSLLGLLLSLRLVAPSVGRAFADHTKAVLGQSGSGDIGGVAGANIMSMFVVGLVPFLAVAGILATAGGIAQVGFTFAPKAAKPKWSNLSLKKGLNRFKPSVFGWELVRTVLKLGLLIAVIWGPITSWIARLGSPLGLVDALGFTGDQVWALVLRATILALGIAGADYAVTRLRTSKELKMTKQELKEEVKHSEGNPMLKAARRRRAMEMSRNRMIAEVAVADVVVTNPTHLAIALRYDPTEAAPRVLAKGANKLAAKIRREAYRNGITVLEDKPLARTLYRRVKVGHFVPTTLFEAVATVLAVAYRRRGRRKAAA